VFAGWFAVEVDLVTLELGETLSSDVDLFVRMGEEDFFAVAFLTLVVEIAFKATGLALVTETFDLVGALAFEAFGFVVVPLEAEDFAFLLLTGPAPRKAVTGFLVCVRTY